jgi:iron-sulfur cluster repair protein YtfE (RIC family)
MKRHEGITTLSREHHFGLLFCWKIRQGIKKQVLLERIKHYVKYFWDNHLSQHFQDEERLLFATIQNSICDQAIAEHQHIRRMVETISSEDPVSPDGLHSLADSLEKHIRFEERTLFPQIENELSDEALMEIGLRLTLSHEVVLKDNYPDEFWV